MDSWLEAAEDPHAFTWLPGRPRGDHQRPGRDAHVDGAAARRARRVADRAATSARSAGGAPAALPLEDGRVALVGDQVRIVDLR